MVRKYVLTAAQARDAQTGGATCHLALGAHRVRVVRRDVAGLIDINTAAPDLLAKAFASLGLPGTVAASITDLRANRRVIVACRTHLIAPFLPT